MDTPSTPKKSTVDSSLADSVSSPVFTPSSRRLQSPHRSHHRVRSIGEWFHNVVSSSPSSKTLGTVDKKEEEAFTPSKMSQAVEEERTIRNLFSTSAAVANKRAPSRDGNMFEFFCVVRCGFPEPRVAWWWPSSSSQQHETQEQPPYSALPYFAHFCAPFPSSSSSSPPTCFVFSMSDPSTSQRLYVCCVPMASSPHDKPLAPSSLLKQRPMSIAASPSSHRRSLSGSDAHMAHVGCVSNTRVICMVTKYPYVDMVMHVLRGVAAHMKEEQQGEEDEHRQLGEKAMADLRRFHIPVPEVDETIQIVGRSSLDVNTDQVITWSRRTENVEEEEQQMVGDWVSPVGLASLQEWSFLCGVLSLAMLEKSVVIHSESLDQVSSCVFTLQELMKPFVYQAVCLPLIPDTLREILESPVPFILGMHSSGVSSTTYEQHPGVCFVNLDTGRVVSAAAVPRIPFEADLKKTIAPLLQQLISVQKGAEVRSPKARDLARQIVAAFTEFWNAQFGDFRKHCVRDLTNPEAPVTIFMQDAFLAEKSYSGGQEWFRAFFKTQMWSSHSDEKRTRFDLQRRNSLLSARMIAEARAQRSPALSRKR